MLLCPGGGRLQSRKKCSSFPAQLARRCLIRFAQSQLKLRQLPLIPLLAINTCASLGFKKVFVLSIETAKQNLMARTRLGFLVKPHGLSARLAFFLVEPYGQSARLAFFLVDAQRQSARLALFLVEFHGFSADSASFLLNFTDFR